MYNRVEDKCVFVFRHKLFVLAAVRSPHVLELYAVECRRASPGASVDGEFTLAAVSDRTEAVNVLVTVGNFSLVE